MAVLVAHAFLKLAGLYIKKVIPNKYGLEVSDSFAVCYDAVLGSAFFVGEQCIEPAYLPVFSAAWKKDGEERAWKFTSTLFNLQFVILLAIVAAMMLCPEAILSLATRWKSSGEGEAAAEHAQKALRFDIATGMLCYIAPGLLGMSLASLTYAVLNGYKEFFFAAFGDAVLKLCILGGALLGAFIGARAPDNTIANWRWVAAGAVAGGTLKLATHLFALGFQRVRKYQISSFDLRDPYLRDFAILILPLLAGILLARVRDLMMTNVLTQAPGVPTFFSNGRVIVDSISFLVPYTLSIALLPFFCDIAARDDRQRLGEVLTRIIRVLVWFFVPLCVVLAAASFPVSMLVFSGKKINAEGGAHIALVLKLFCIQLPFLAIEIMSNQAFFSTRRMIAPTVAGLVFSILSALAAQMLITGGESTSHILLVVALCYVVSRVLKAVLLIALLKWTVPVLPFKTSIGYFVQVTLAGCASAAAAWGAQYACEHPLAAILRKLPEFASFALESVLIGLAGAAVYLAVSLALRMEEPRLCVEWTREKLRQRKARA